MKKSNCLCVCVGIVEKKCQYQLGSGLMWGDVNFLKNLFELLFLF